MVEFTIEWTDGGETKSVVAHVPLDITIGNLKEEIRREAAQPSTIFKLLYGRRLLPESETIGKYNIEDGSILVCTPFRKYTQLSRGGRSQYLETVVIRDGDTMTVFNVDLGDDLEDIMTKGQNTRISNVLRARILLDLAYYYTTKEDGKDVAKIGSL